jgi:hypothetical protein
MSNVTIINSNFTNNKIKNGKGRSQKFDGAAIYLINQSILNILNSSFVANDVGLSKDGG